MTTVSIIGQIATDPKLFTKDGGAEFCTFRLASTERRYDAAKSEWVDTDTNWFTVNAFRSLARHASQSFKKGERIIVVGKLRVRPWEKDDKKGTSVEIDADGVGHDLRFGTSVFTKQDGSTQPSTAPSSPQAAACPDTEPITGQVPGQPGGSDAAPSPGAFGASAGAGDGAGEAMSADGFTPAAA